MGKKNVAVILAAGNGERSGFEIPKQMMKLAGKPIVEHTITIFQNCSSIDEIIVVSSANCIERIEEIVSSRAFSKVKKVIKGGQERYESSVAAINASEPVSDQEDVNLIFHDAVRPLVSDRIILDVIQSLDYYNAVDVVVATTDTIISADPITNTIESVPVRQRLRNGQTPQGFKWKTIKTAYELAFKDPDFKTTDDCGVVLKYLPDEKIFLVNGEHNNIKLTYKEDLQIIDKLLQLNTKKTICNNLTSHSLAQLKGKVIVILGGTSGIGAEMAAIAEAYQAKVVVASRRTGLDVTNLNLLQNEFKAIHERYGRIDYVVNTAGILVKQPLVLMEYKDIVEAIQINYLGAVHVALAAYEYLKESRGHMLNFTSSSYTYGRAYYSLYSSSKAAIVNLTQALAEEWHTQFIRINCINPERTNTPMRRKAFGIEPLDSLLSARSVALLSLGVLLDDSTGQVLDITSQYVKKAINNGALTEETIMFK
ncbi:bifunctional cytidylyltransferase/SDR family oxidoreductase [Chitinophagaceae bacterium LB-8]|uniref:Bifunctional cytidylyltransferase/SDR family oxidoreductase n=1 Tax=Paraflavisolibacter caeni TaxID=2982496 RepID=A0A9X2XTV5_9BACT|nr:bifunctional cytidylyltransferase/SDR family oxidoreductase [Paraflavisolibacter caeni]MCU7548267.1 bifunctional cytidylyltransferase/SDR family oxidoreductase [Paraflavisolibacter caeni]